MVLIACGLNHQTAPLIIREKLHFSPEQMPASLLELVSQAQVKEAAILSTCNRTELYCNTEFPEAVLPWLRQHYQSVNEDISPYLYLHQDQAALKHMLRVASGLDSMVVGEPQIFGQMKTAFNLAKQAGTINGYLHRIFAYIFATTKQVRATTAIGVNPVSIASAAVHLAQHIFTDLSQRKILLIGAGDTIELAARHFYDQGIGHLLFANRTLKKAESLAHNFQGLALTLTDLNRHLAEADIVITATASPVPILGKGIVESALKQRKYRPMFMVDLAVPRDIEPEVSSLSDVYLYTIDDLQGILKENMQQRLDAAQEAAKIINLRVEQFTQHLRALNAAATIRDFRANISKIRDQEVQHALQRIRRGESPELVVQYLAHRLSNKFMHTPSVQLRKAAHDDERADIAAARRLFKLTEE